MAELYRCPYCRNKYDAGKYNSCPFCGAPGPEEGKKEKPLKDGAYCDYCNKKSERNRYGMTLVTCPHCGAFMPEWHRDFKSEYVERGENCRYQYIDCSIRQMVIGLPVVAALLFMAAYAALWVMGIQDSTFLVVMAAVIILLVMILATWSTAKGVIDFRKWRKYIRKHGTMYQGRIKDPVTVGGGKRVLQTFSKMTGAKRFPVTYYSTIQNREMNIQSRYIAWRKPCQREMVCDVYEIPESERPEWAEPDPMNATGVVNWYGDIIIENIRVR